MTQGDETTAGGILSVADAMRSKHGWKPSAPIAESGFFYVHEGVIHSLPPAVKLKKSSAGGHRMMCNLLAPRHRQSR